MHEHNKVYSMLQKVGRISKDKRRRLHMSALYKQISNIIWATIPTVIIGRETIIYTMDKRGYFAIGGEWILMIMIFLVACGILDKKKATH